jgi:hypothetical protein
MIDADQEALVISSFLQAQLSPLKQLELQSLVLSEFIEALSRVALNVIDNNR